MLNNKGMTIIEIIICFAIVSVISINLFSMINKFSNKKIIESDKKEIYTYKNILTKKIQDDIIRIGILNAYIDGHENYSSVFEAGSIVTKKKAFTGNYDVTLAMRDGTTRQIKVKNKRSHGNIENKIDEIVQNDEFSIGYGIVAGGDTSKFTWYDLPDVGSTVNNFGEKVLDLRISNVYISNKDGVFSFYLGFEHSDIGNQMAIKIVAPIRFDDVASSQSSIYKDTSSKLAVNVINAREIVPDQNSVQNDGITRDSENNLIFAGGNPKNFVRLGSDLWRIVGVFKGIDGKNRLKLVRNAPINSRAYHSNSNEQLFDHTDIYKYLNTNYYNSLSYKNVIENYKSGTYVNTLDDLSGQTGEVLLRDESRPNNMYASLNYISLLNPSDVVMASAGLGGVSRGECIRSEKWFSSNRCNNSSGNYLLATQNYWLERINAKRKKCIYVNGSKLMNSDCNVSRNIFPVIYLKDTVSFTNTNPYDLNLGTSSNPYTVS